MAEPSDNPEHGVPSVPGKVKKVMERPEQTFERRRKLFFGLLLFVVVSGGLFIFQSCSKPVNVSGMFAAPAQATPPSGLIAGATMTPVRAVLPPVVVVVPSATPGIVNGALTCWAIADFSTREGLIPANAQVRVYGFTNAKGGLVLVGTDWVSTSLVRCDGDVAQLERPFVIAATPTREPRAPAVIVVTATPGPNYIYPTPAPVAPVVQMATPVNGLWTSGTNCWTINVQGVQQIWVNNKPATTGTFCGVTDLHVVVGGQP